jgi:hypothetical protein
MKQLGGALRESEKEDRERRSQRKQDDIFARIGKKTRN